MAVLGMLIANIPWHAGESMSRIHDIDATSVMAWLLQYALVDQRFMPVFCMLFGAGAILLADKRLGNPGFSAFYLRRMAILFGIGLAHAYLLWPGDILLTYAICGPVLLLFMRASPIALLAWGVGFKLLDIAILQWPVIYQAGFHSWMFSWWLEVGDAPMSGAEAYAGTYGDLFSYNAWRNVFLQWTAMPYFRLWNALGFMLIGMALYRWGILQARSGKAVEMRMIRWSLIGGLPPLLYGLMSRIGGDPVVGPHVGWTQALPLSTAAHMLGAALTSIALLGALLTIYRHSRNAGWTAAVRAVGKMALTNYIMHSLIFVIVFAGLQWRAYGSLDPDERLIWVVVIWAFQIAFSMIWLKYLGQGPLERVWRALSGRG